MRGRRLKGMGKGVLGARETRGGERAGREGNPPPSRVVSRPNSLPLPFRTPATQATGDEMCPVSVSGIFTGDGPVS